ncbi:MAG: helix-turn-helix transcriptional regulator [Oscillospiraceae bacterium]|nr:helix-turn-helix transcriptional regulator [Oscillospiraceae bacterium]
MKLQEKILMLRKSRGLSQEELAEKLNVSRQAISRWETGTALPDAANLLELSRLFGVTADYLLNDDYESDGDVPAVKTTVKAANRKLRRIAGLCMTAFGLLGNFVIYILSRMIEVMVPRITYTEDGTKMYTWSSNITAYSYRYFIQERNLELLTAFFFLLILGGLTLYFYKKEYFAPLLARLRHIKSR